MSNGMPTESVLTTIGCHWNLNFLLTLQLRQPALADNGLPIEWLLRQTCFSSTLQQFIGTSIASLTIELAH